MVMIPCGGFGIGNGLSVEKDEFGRPMLNANGGSGDNSFIVNFTWIDDESEEAGGHFISDKTSEEVYEATISGKNVVGITDGEGTIYLCSTLIEGDGYLVEFFSIHFTDSETIELFGIKLKNSSCTNYYMHITGTPIES